MDIIPVFNMDRQGHPTGVYGAKTEAGKYPSLSWTKYLCLSWTKYLCLSWTDRDTLQVCMRQRQRQGYTCVYHGQNACVFHGQTGTPYRCVWGKDRGREIPEFIVDKIHVFIMDKIPVFIMDIIPVFIMNRQGHPTGVHGAKTEARSTCVYHGHNTCVYHGQTGTPYRCVWGKDRGREIPEFIVDKIPVFIMDKIPVFIMDIIPVFIMNRQGHPTGLHGAKTEARNTCVYHGHNTCVYHGQTGTPYRCVLGKDGGKEIPVFIMDITPVFIMDRQGHPTGVYGAKTEARKYLCLSWT